MDIPQRTNKEIDLSVVVPFFNEKESVLRLHDALFKSLAATDIIFEAIYVDDGSTDGTRDILKQLAKENNNVRVILFRANFGQSAAMGAGFEATKGRVVVAMDGDLQNDPSDIPLLLAKLEEGYDVISGWRKNRQDKVLMRKIPSKIANRLICSVTDVKLHDTGCSLKAFRGDMLRRITLYGEFHRFIPALMRMEGARIAELPVKHHARKYGQSKYNLSRTFRVIMDLTTIRMLMRHLKNPLEFFIGFGGLFMVAGSVSLFAILYKWLVMSNSWAQLNILTILAALFLATFVQFMFLGLIGRLIVESGSRKSLVDLTRDQ